LRKRDPTLAQGGNSGQTLRVRKADSDDIERWPPIRLTSACDRIATVATTWPKPGTLTIGRVRRVAKGRRCRHRQKRPQA
jgi:hypothetical protein